MRWPGDSRNDLLTVRAADVRCVLVGFGYTDVPARELGADAVVDELAELPQVLASLDSDGRQHLDRTPAGPGA